MNSLENSSKAKSLEATITIEYSNPQVAESVAKAVSPDNFKTPPGLSVKTKRNGNQVFTEISAETKITTLIATIDDLLMCISTAEKALGILKTKDK
jgi:tRNA threonylcarbamoyladenosine modification (KEOPS) complex  Pcc1 subunit